MREKKSVVERIRVLITILSKETYTKEEVVSILRELLDD